jgi:hypothetical protein
VKKERRYGQMGIRRRHIMQIGHSIATGFFATPTCPSPKLILLQLYSYHHKHCFTETLAIDISSFFVTRSELFAF